MRRIEFINLLKEFARRPVPVSGRHIYLWLETKELLLSEAPPSLAVHLDLHELCQHLEIFPSSDTAARETLEKAITVWLAQEFHRDGRQHMLIVSGGDLLARYQMALSAFVRATDETRLIVLACPAKDTQYRPVSPLPTHVLFQPEATEVYIRSLLPEGATIGE